MFSLDASFQESHGGQAIRIAVVRRSGQAVVAAGRGRVSADSDPSFTFSAAAVLGAGEDYEVHYWIDSSIGGGTVGACDEKTIDHQWSVKFFSVSNDKVFAVSHDDSLTEDVCGSFT